MHCQLADEDSARVLESGRSGGVHRRHSLQVNVRAGSGAGTGRVVEVLEREGDAVHRAPVVALQHLRLGGARLRHGLVGHKGHERMQAVIGRFDAVQAGAKELDRRQLPGTHQLPGLAHGQKVELIGVGHIRSPRFAV